jgi:hypothetical protein
MFDVGTLYSPTRTSWEERIHLRLMPGWSELLVCLRKLTSEEVASLDRKEIRLAWLPGERVSMILSRFGGGPWSDASYEAHRDRDDAERFMRATGQNSLIIPLVDASSGIIRATRTIQMPPLFLRAMRDSVAQQLSRPHDISTAQRELQGYLARKSDELAKLAPHVFVVPAKS